MRSSADGWRGVIGEEFRPSYVGELARAVVDTVRASGPCDRVLVTYDGRRDGEAAARHVVAHCLDAGLRVRLVPHLPTPSASRAVAGGTVDLALLVTASHNPPAYNGLKVKVSPGGSLSRAAERAVEARYADQVGRSGPRGLPSAAWVDEEDATGWIDEHIDHVWRVGAPAVRPARVVVDGLGGIAGEPVAALCTRLGWTVHRIGCAVDEDFGGLVPDPSMPQARQRAAHRVQEVGADLGIVLDGDGDRVYLLDRTGDTVHPHELFGMLLEHRGRTGRGHPGRPVAVTVSAGTAARHGADRLGKPVRECPVGFKHLSPLLAGGEIDAACGAVGDMAFAEFGIDRDPLSILVLLADLLARSGAALHELTADVRRAVGPLEWVETRIGMPAAPELLIATGASAVAALGIGDVMRTTAVDGIKLWVADGQWLLLRPSTTEPFVRVYGELLGQRIGAADVHGAVARALDESVAAVLGTGDDTGLGGTPR
ncbi:hypothetical protein ABT063_30765 [Streptomyces sp. NPDC002838]|uniref:hypothetical protein n=1 Tax=Streptomyces sp. NPDC002838 TaxID=3154436 RepID=UPI003332B192